MANLKPTITFTVNLANKEVSSLPYNINLVGNQTVSEYDAQIDSRSTWLSSLGNAGKDEAGYGTGANIDKKNGNTVVAHGTNALYLKKTYANGTTNDLLKVISIEW